MGQFPKKTGQSRANEERVLVYFFLEPPNVANNTKKGPFLKPVPGKLSVSTKKQKEQVYCSLL